MSNDALRAEIAAAVEDYRRVFPEPYALAPNLDLAVRAIALTPEPPTDDEREVIIDVIRKALDVQSGHIYPEFSVRQAEWATDALLASPVWRNRHRGPITDEMVAAVKGLNIYGISWMTDEEIYAALEAAEAAR